MRNAIVIAGTIALFSAALAATPQVENDPASSFAEMPVKASPNEGARADDRKPEKPIRVILRSPFEIASPTIKEK